MKKLLCLALSLLMCFASINITRAKDGVDDNKYCKTPLKSNIDTSSYNNSKLDDAVKKITSQIKSDMTTVEKVVFVHDYIGLNCEYDYDNYLKDSIPDVSYTAYGCLVSGVAVAQGYAAAFDLVMEKLNIDCIVVSSSELMHAWNLVKVDGNWYHVDITWDDPVYDTLGYVAHNFLLLSDAAITRKLHDGWDTSYKCTSTKYDNAFWTDLNSAFYVHDGWWYCLDFDDVISKSKGLFGIRDEYMDLAEYSYCYPGCFIYDGSYFYIETYVNYLDGSDSYEYSYVKRINISDKRIDTVLKKGGYIDGLLYKNGKYYYQVDQVVKEFNASHIIEKASITILDPSINVLVDDMSLLYSYYVDSLYESEPMFTLVRCYSKDTSIADIEDDMVVGKKLGKTQIVIEGENGVKKYVDVNVMSTLLDIGDDEEDVLYIGEGMYVGFDFKSSNPNVTEDDVVLSSSNSSVIAVESEYHWVDALKAGTATLTLTAPDKVTSSKTVKVVDTKGWHEYNGHKYYINKDGTTATELTKIGNDTYIFEWNGRMSTGWISVDDYDYSKDRWYTYNCYFNTDGKMAKGWQSVDNKICYFNTSTGHLEKDFKDVRSGKWYYTTVVDALKSGLMSGTGEETFSPEDNMTRGMIVTVLHRIAGKPNVAYTGKFKDVSQSSYYATAVEWAAKNKVVSGYSNGKFGPNDNITRQDVAVILYNYARSLGLDVTNDTDLSKFADYKNVSNYAKPAMQWAVSVGILRGATDKATGKVSLNPKNNATRAECAKMLLVASELYKK